MRSDSCLSKTILWEDNLKVCPELVSRIGLLIARPQWDTKPFFDSHWQIHGTSMDTWKFCKKTEWKTVVLSGKKRHLKQYLNYQWVLAVGLRKISLRMVLMKPQVWSELLRSSCCKVSSDTGFLGLFTVMLCFIPQQQHFQSSLWFLLRTGHFNCAKLCQMWELWDLKWCKLGSMNFSKSTN